MKLNIVPARIGFQWALAGVRTFFRQPLALAGLFFMFMGSLTVLSLVPFIGGLLALMLLPAATLGLMAATRDATQGKFPMPSRLLTAFRESPDRGRSMWVLGALYALIFLGILALSALADGGKFAKAYFAGGMGAEQLGQADFRLAIWTTLLLYVPVSMLFWHAPALLHWHGLPPAKSLFFSFIACVRNWRAMLLYGLAWFAMLIGISSIMGILMASLLGPGVVQSAMPPLAMLVAAMFFTSIYFSYIGTFESNPESEP
ncbi:MAG: hypothetical protein RLZZ126_758 [Pseudomonadota bacterium]|jgi:hypothetical protein